MSDECSEILLKCSNISCSKESPDEKLLNYYLYDGSSEEDILLDGEHLQIEMSTDSETEAAPEIFQESSLTEYLEVGNEVEVQSENDIRLNLSDVQLVNDAAQTNIEAIHYNRKLYRKRTPYVKPNLGSARTRFTNIRKPYFSPAYSSTPIRNKVLERDIYEQCGLSKILPNKKCKVEYIHSNFYAIMELGETLEVSSTFTNRRASVLPLNLTFEGDALENQCEDISNENSLLGIENDDMFPDKSKVKSQNNGQSSNKLILGIYYQEKLILIRPIALTRMPGFLNIYRFCLQYIKYFPFIVLLDFRKDCPISEENESPHESERWSFISTWKKVSTKQYISGLCFVARRDTPFSLHWIQSLLKNDPDGNNGLDIHNLIQIKFYNKRREFSKSCSVNSKVNHKEISQTTRSSADSNMTETSTAKNLNHSESYLEIFKKYLCTTNNNEHITKKAKPAKITKYGLRGRNKINSNQNMIQNLHNVVKPTTNLNYKFRNLEVVDSKRLSKESVRDDVKPTKITKASLDIKDQFIKKLRNNQRGLVINKQKANKIDIKSQQLSIDCLQKVIALQDISITRAKPKPAKIEEQKSEYHKIIPKKSLHLEEIVFPEGTTNINSTSQLVVYLNKTNDNNSGNVSLSKNTPTKENSSIKQQCKVPLTHLPDGKKFSLRRVDNNCITMQPNQFVEYSPMYNSTFLIGPSNLPPGRYYLHPMPRGVESFNNIMLKVELMHKYNLGYEKVSTEELMKIPDFEFLPTNVQMSDI